MFKKGDKVKIDKERLKIYCDKFHWNFEKLNNDYVTIKNKLKEVEGSSVYYSVGECCGIYPEDCLIDERYEKLKKILCQ